MKRRTFLTVAASGMGLLSGCSSIVPGPKMGVTKGDTYYLASVGDRSVEMTLNIEYPSKLQMGTPTHVPLEVTMTQKKGDAEQRSLDSVKVLMIPSGGEKEHWSTTEVDWGETVGTEFSFVYPQTRELNITYLVTPIFGDGAEGVTILRSDELIAESEYSF